MTWCCHTVQDMNAVAARALSSALMPACYRPATGVLSAYGMYCLQKHYIRRILLNAADEKASCIAW